MQTLAEEQQLTSILLNYLKENPPPVELSDDRLKKIVSLCWDHRFSGDREEFQTEIAEILDRAVNHHQLSHHR